MDKANYLQSAHGFMDTTGGVSSGVYSSLNCGLGSRDDPHAVKENRLRVAARVSGRRIPIVSPYQMHGATAHWVGDDFDISTRPEADALVTARPDILIGILTADCCPILLEDKQAGLVAAAHAGWKGAAGGIIESTIKLMLEKGAHLDTIRAAIGPTIAKNSYEVRADMKKAVMAVDQNAASHFYGGRDADHYQFDLPGYVINRLSRAGIKAPENLAIDTYASDRHFSYRRTCHLGQADYGRFLSVIMVS